MDAFEQVATDNLICKMCGVGLAQLLPDHIPEYCNRCNPRYPRVKVDDLQQLPSVPAAYRRLVELGILHDLPYRGDVEFLFANDLVPARRALPCIEKNPHLQPFARTVDGDLWCWSPLRTGPNGESEILRVSSSLALCPLVPDLFVPKCARNSYGSVEQRAR
jgi:hypothetical protein